ncbi:hypothetical protein [Myxococcus sp. RHSTA-1-4]|uniref:hypothetical protein n=1 Tax=Myxococcus sp. RHSTA-1-4 TaxID=2874601 RepID=UPI001CC03109|nr:hypothetical protein [Myxococcus sp. RHSTA-1-4]
MNRSALLSACVAVSLCACSERPSGPAAEVDAGAARASAEVPDAGALTPEPPPVAAVEDAGAPDAGALAEQTASPDAGSAACSAGTLSAKTHIPIPPPPPAVERMRRAIITAAVACDYAALGALANENGQGLRFSFNGGKDPVAFWRKAEAEGEPVLARMVQVLNLPGAKQGDLYFWPAVHVTNAENDWKAKDGGTGYLGLRLGITSKGDWQLAVAGD